MIKRSDLEKIFDVMERAYQFHMHRDIMNAQLHLASQTRFSPLTTELSAALDRMKAALETAPPNPGNAVAVGGVRGPGGEPPK